LVIYPVGDALANIALYKNVVHNCEHVQGARNNTINIIVSNVLKQKFFYSITRIIIYLLYRDVAYNILNVVHNLIRERASKCLLPR